MNEFSFVGFDVAADGCNLQLPIKAITDLRFFIPETITDINLIEQTLTAINLIDEAGDFIRTCAYDFDSGWVALKTTSITDLTCFRLQFVYDNEYYTSNLFRYTSTGNETILVKYLCFEEQFGFDYTITVSYNQLRLPIVIKEPQFPQEKKIYVDGNGVRQLLMSKIDKEYILETEYMPVEWHENLIVALSHDEVYFNAEKLQKSAPYEINYDEYDELPCGTRLYKASAKLIRNTTLRNNNC